MMLACLTTRQLCDLVNYVLGLPTWLGGFQTKEPVTVPVVASWPKYPARAHVECWCHRQLEMNGMLPTAKKRGRRSIRFGMIAPPRELWMFAPQSAWRNWV